MTATAMYLCAACGKVASTVRLVEPGQPDPRLTPEPPGTPPGTNTTLSSTFPKWAQLSIDGGPVSYTIAPAPMEAVTAALHTGNAADLYAVNWEFAPFWCLKCEASYCRDHYRKREIYDDGFFDCINGTCPKGHERMLTD